MSNASSGESRGTPITLGGRDYHLVPQRIGRISKKLTQIVELFGEQAAGGGLGSLGVDEAGGAIGTGLYDVLKVFIPDLAPMYELAGYRSEEDYGAREKWERERDEARGVYAAEVRGLNPADPGAVGWEDLSDEEQAGFEFPGFVDPYDEAADRSPTPPEIMDAVETIFKIHGGQRLVRLLKNVVGLDALKAMIRTEALSTASRRSRSSLSPSGASDSTTSSATSPTPEAQEAPESEAGPRSD